MKNWIQSAVTGLLLERPGQKRTLEEHAADLADFGAQLAEYYASCPETSANCEQLRHIIGIERWGQRRLRVFLGDPLVEDDYDGYRPPQELDWEGLQAAFQETRAATVALAETLAQVELNPAETVPHNQYGKLTVFGWLHYLAAHANLESRRMR